MPGGLLRQEAFSLIGEWGEPMLRRIHIEAAILGAGRFTGTVWARTPSSRSWPATMRVKPGQEAEYCRRHRAVWPEMLQGLKDARCSNYSIFMKGQDPFACMEVTDFERFKRQMAVSPDARRWEAHMAGIMERGILPETGFPRGPGRDVPP